MLGQLHLLSATFPVDHHRRNLTMFRSTRTLRRFTVGALSVAALAGAFGVGAVVAQQQTATTKVTALTKQAISEYPGHEVTMLTLDIPPGGGSPPHRHPGHHIFGYVLEGAYAIKLDDGPERTLTKGESFERGAASFPCAKRPCSSPAKASPPHRGRIAKEGPRHSARAKLSRLIFLTTVEGCEGIPENEHRQAAPVSWRAFVNITARSSAA
jgi:quercetin dioxygenase-like cupin family protein